jgi:hypothetical protein
MLPQGEKGSVTTVQSEANLALQYMASTVPTLVPQFGTPHSITQAAGIHVLPHYIDELEQDFGTDMYLRMLNDAQVKACDATLRDAILDKPLQVLPYSGDDIKDDVEGQAFAQKIADFVRANFEELPGGFHLVSWDLLEGISLGYKLGEMVFEVKEIVPGNGPQTCLAAIKTKPHEAVSIVVDQYNDELGYIPRMTNVGLYGTFLAADLPTATNVLDPTTGQKTEEVEIPGLVPPEKVVRFTWQPRNDDPRGTSNLRGAYVPWRLKIGLYPAYEAYLARFAQPSTALELEGATDLPPMSAADGRLITNPVEKLQAMLTALRSFQSGGAMVLPVGHLNMVQATSNGQAYLLAFELVDEQITKSILLQNLSTEGGKYGTQALGKVHQDTLGLLVAMGKHAFTSCIRERVVKLLVRLNYGEAGMRYLPTLSFGETEQQDLAALMGAYANLMGGGTPETRLLFPVQYNDVFDQLHMKPLDEAFIAKLQALIDKQITAAVQVAEDPMGLKAQAEAAQAQGAVDEEEAAAQEAEQESYY